MSFSDFCIDPKCVQLLKKQGITEPTPIQEQAIPVALEGNDVVAIAQTGTGKTLAFGLPALTQLTGAKPGKNRMLVLTPTRELAQQVESVLRPLGRTLNLHTTTIYGGANIGPQIKALRRGCDIIVATPGRLLDHLERGTVRFDKLSMLVLDEADRMLDMGFMPDIKRIMKTIPKNRQTLMFSATFPKEIEKMANELLNQPVRVEVGSIAKPTETVRQSLYTVESAGKMRLLSDILNGPDIGPTIVFIRTKHRTDRVAKALHRKGFKAQAIHGGRTQRQRDQAIDGFRNGRYSILIATDVAARGIDVQGITHVVNYDIPGSSEDYIHRIGRTARASAEGDAITFVSPEEGKELGAIERALGKSLPREDWDGAVTVNSHFDNKPKKQSARKKRFVPRRGGNGGGGGARPQGRRRSNKAEARA